jgi:hypothetical protein
LLQLQILISSSKPLLLFGPIQGPLGLLVASTYVRIDDYNRPST